MVGMIYLVPPRLYLRKDMRENPVKLAECGEVKGTQITEGRVENVSKIEEKERRKESDEK